MKRFLAVLLTLSMLVGMSVPAFAAEDKNLAAAQRLEKIGLLKSTNGDFKLTEKVTRGEAISYVVKMLGGESELSTVPAPGFSDVAKKHKYYSYIAYAKDIGLITGAKNTKFKPDSPMTEKAFLEIIVKALGYSTTDYLTKGIFKFAYESKVVTDSAYLTRTKENAAFNRGNIASILDAALMQNFANETTSPLIELLNDEVITWDSVESAGYMYRDETPTGISSVLVNSATSIRIKINEPIKTYESAIITEKADTTKVLTLVKAESDASDSLIFTTANQTPGTEYTVTLKNVIDKQGHTVSNVSYTFKGFTPAAPVEVNSAYFKIKKIVPISKNQIDVYFTQPAGSSCESATNYEISKDGVVYETGSLATMSCASNISKKEVVSLWLKNKTFEEGKSYTIKISGDSASLYGAKLGSGKGDSATFLGKGDENIGLKIVDIVPVDNNVIDVVFNKDLDLLSAQNVSNYQVIDRAKDQYIRIIKADIILGGIGQKTARLRFATDLVLNNNYELVVKDVKDRLKSSTVSDERVVYTHKNPAIAQLKIDSIYCPDRGTLFVYFNRPLSSSAAVAKFQISGGPNISQNVIFDPEVPNQIILFTATGLMAGNTYMLTASSGISDISGNVQTMPLAASFIANATSPGTVSINGARMVSENQILVSLNVPISNNTKANQFSLEYLDGKITKLKTCSTITFIDNTTIVLSYEGGTAGTSYILKGMNIMDFTNQYTTATVSSGVESGN